MFALGSRSSQGSRESFGRLEFPRTIELRTAVVQVAARHRLATDETSLRSASPLKPDTLGGVLEGSRCVSTDYRSLFEAIIHGDDVDGVRDALVAGFDANECDQWGWTLVHRAAANNRPGVIHVLVEHHARVEQRSSIGWAPLHLAAISGSPRATQALLDCGSSPVVENATGETPLHFIAISRNLEVATILLAAGADPKIPNHEGESPVSLARAKGLDPLVNLFERY